MSDARAAAGLRTITPVTSAAPLCRAGDGDIGRGCGGVKKEAP
ncbi:hypothetical protein [Streptomyces sp. 8N706]